MAPHRMCFGCFLVFVSLSNATRAIADATVNYQGRLYYSALGGGGPGSGPVQGGFVVAGTSAPGFLPANFYQVYGDEFGNVAVGSYSDSVADGGFRPIGSGVYTDGNGYFSGSGMTSAVEGTRVYLFGFGQSDPDYAFTGVLASGLGSSFLVPADMGTTSIDAINANLFAFGVAAQDGIALAGLPIPEPAAFAVMLLGAPALLFRSKRLRA